MRPLTKREELTGHGRADRQFIGRSPDHNIDGRANAADMKTRSIDPNRMCILLFRMMTLLCTPASRSWQDSQYPHPDRSQITTILKIANKRAQ